MLYHICDVCLGVVNVLQYRIIWCCGAVLCRLHLSFKSVLLCVILIELGVPKSAPVSAPWESPATASSFFLGAVSGPMSYLATVEAFIVLRVSLLFPVIHPINRASCLCCKLLFTCLSSSSVAVFFSCCVAARKERESRVSITPSDA